MSQRAGFWLVIALLMSAMAQKAVRFSTIDPDAFWHMRVAEQLHRDGIGPLIDELSFMSIRTPWIPYSWLAELGMQAAWKAAGLCGAVVVQAVLGAIIISLVALSCLQVAGVPPQSDHYMPAIIGTLLAGAWMLVFLAFRPVTLAIAILASCAFLLLRDRRLQERTGAVWLLVPLTALAANVHIFAVLIPCWIAALLVGSLIERKPAHRYALLLILSIMALCATPMLRGIPGTIAHLAADDPMVASGQVQELAPIWSDAYGMFIAVTAAGAVSWIFYNRKRYRIGELIWLSGMIVLLLRFGRFAPLFALIAAPMLARSLPGLPDRILDRSFIAVACAAALLVGLVQTIAALPRANADSCAWLNRLGTAAPAYPCAAVDFVEKYIPRDTGRLINEMDFGGYLAWRLRNEWKVLIDGRTQCFPPDVWRAYLGTQEQVKQFLAPLRADAAILPATRSRIRIPLQTLGWRVVYQDHYAVVLSPPAR